MGVNTSWGGSIIMLLNENGGTKKMALTAQQKEDLGVTTDTVAMTFQYASAAECAEWDDGTTPGWYLLVDENALYNMNDITVDAGKGFLFKPGEPNAQVQSAGAVVTEDTALSAMVGGEYNLTGNITPANIELGDIVGQNTGWGGSIIMFLNANGGTKKMALTAQQKEDMGITTDTVAMTFQYASAAECAEWDDGTTPGWYLLADENALYNMNDIPVVAGEGFLFKPGEPNATLVIPGAL